MQNREPGSVSFTAGEEKFEFRIRFRSIYWIPAARLELNGLENPEMGNKVCPLKKEDCPTDDFHAFCGVQDNDPDPGAGRW